MNHSAFGFVSITVAICWLGAPAEDLPDLLFHALLLAFPRWVFQTLQSACLLHTAGKGPFILSFHFFLSPLMVCCQSERDVAIPGGFDP